MRLHNGITLAPSFRLRTPESVCLCDTISFWPRSCPVLRDMAKEVVKATVSKASSLSFEPDILAPNQYLNNCQRTSPAEPEKALMFAVLAEAVDTYQRFAFSDSPRGRLLSREVEDWFWGERPADSVFAFRSICEIFGLDPSFLKHGLMQWTASRVTSEKDSTSPGKRSCLQAFK
jgi:hypothetical protein